MDDIDYDFFEYLGQIKIWLHRGMNFGIVHVLGSDRQVENQQGNVCSLKIEDVWIKPPTIST